MNEDKDGGWVDPKGLTAVRPKPSLRQWKAGLHGQKPQVKTWKYLCLIVSLILLLLVVILSLFLPKVLEQTKQVQGEIIQLKRKVAQGLADAGHDRDFIRGEMFRQIESVRADNGSFCQPCSPAWKAFQGSCYLFSTDNLTWTQANESCFQKQAHLVIINSQAEQVPLNTKMVYNPEAGVAVLTGAHLPVHVHYGQYLEQMRVVPGCRDHVLRYPPGDWHVLPPPRCFPDPGLYPWGIHLPTQLDSPVLRDPLQARPALRGLGRRGLANSLDMGNQTQVSEFILLGFSEQPQQQQLLFSLSFTLYLIGGLGNLLTILAITLDSHLHRPMYFFLSNLSFLDICFTSTTIPKMLANHLNGCPIISSPACLAQMYFFIAFGTAGSILLSAMAYDRYLAICCPLHYVTIMNVLRCALLVAVPWVSANLISMVHTILMTRLSFCTNKILHFFCDLNTLIKLSCSDTQLNEILVLVLGSSGVLIPFVCITASYTPIAMAVWRVPSTQGKWKAFSTCSSHLCVVILFYGTIIGIYFNPASLHTTQRDIAASVMYTVVTPMLNPFIYSLRNPDLKGALWKLLGGNCFAK
ncbi:olfactory receptor 1361-like [Choloepus didactylus]|uniref:olfactory receptor 1361-like n=1 Tax=Choloepus didactylus TaxID=27675 RepID=UPI0018A04BA0|nr:olfactory receptor 1361-like [Choloepus didactylus]